MPGEWKPDPGSKHELRYHDGEQWTEHVSDQGTMSTDPVEGRTQPAAPTITPPVGTSRGVDPRSPHDPSVVQRQTQPTKGGMSNGKVAVLVSACSLLALLLGIAIGAAGSAEERTRVAATGSTTTSTTLSPEQLATAAAEQAAAAKAAADQAAAEKAAADKAAADQAAAQKAAADQAAAQKAAADKAAADKAAADKAAADKAAAAAAAAARAAAAPRTFSGTGSKITDKFTLVSGGYKVTWQARGSDNFIVHIHGQGGRDEGLVNEIPPDPSSGEAFFNSPGGEFYLEVRASTLTWTLTLTKV